MKTHYRTVWISDVHLGSAACKAEMLLDFLSSFKCDNLFLVGDIIDGWALKRRISQVPQSHLNVIRKILSKSKNGTQVFYVIGNHDEFIRKFEEHLDLMIGNIKIGNEFEYGLMLITHGDLYDCITKMYGWISVLGDFGYTLLVYVNKAFNFFRLKFGYPYFSLSGMIKSKVKGAVNFINDFEVVVANEAKNRGLKGVVCGHIHTPCIKKIDGITYHNTGDWVDSCSALVEHLDGKIELVHYK